VSTADLSAGD